MTGYLSLLSLMRTYEMKDDPPEVRGTKLHIVNYAHAAHKIYTHNDTMTMFSLIFSFPLFFSLLLLLLSCGHTHNHNTSELIIDKVKIGHTGMLSKLVDNT